MLRTISAIALALAFIHSPAQTAASPAQGQKKAPAKKDERTVDYEKFVKDLKRIDGNMPLYQKGKKIFLEMPEDKLGKLFLIQAAFNTGLNSMMLHPGMPIGGQAVDAFRFDKGEDSVSLVRPNINNRWAADDAFKVGAERMFPEAILGTYPIEQQDPDKKLLLINISQLFTGDFLHLGEMIAGGLGGMYALDTSRSGPEKVKGFLDNSTVQMKLHYFTPRGGAEQNPILLALGLVSSNTLEDDRSAPVKVTYTMSWRKDTGYIPRYADPRVGFFTTDYFSVGRFLNADKTEKLINRHQLVKKDPKAAVSEPVKPIVFTIDPSIPAVYRPAIKEGVLYWNRAFEKSGFKNAIQVQDTPNDPDYDHADGRYNVIRMMVGPEAPFAAISLLRTDPISGQILNASITIDGNLLQTVMDERQRMMPMPSDSAKELAKQVLVSDPTRKLTDTQLLFGDNSIAQQVVQRENKFGWSQNICDYAGEKAQQSVLDWFALQASPNGTTISREEYVKRYLSECVCHEVGHCLGLRHNFAGSTNLTTAELADDKVTSDKGVSASVMDYTPPNVQAVLKGSGNIYMNTVGPYDIWAIQYGYTPSDAKTSLGEKYMLGQIASQSSVPGHAFMTDEDADSFNPDAVRFDCARDPLAFSEKQIVAFKRARDYAIKNLPRKGESYSERTVAILNSILRTFREGQIAGRFLGGTYYNRNFKGDVNEKPTLQPVSPETQRQAMKLIVHNFFSPDAFDLPTNVLNTLSLNDEGGGWTAPIRQIIGSSQSSLLALSMSASTTNKIIENAYKTNSGAYSIEEHYGTILGNVFSEVGQNKPIKPLRRDLQLFALSGLIIQAGAPSNAISEEVRVVCNDSLKRLNERFVSQLKSGSKLDSITALHLKDMHDQIGRFLNRQLSISR